jgi:hypothetical protein
MAKQKTVSRSSKEELENLIQKFHEESGQSKAVIYERAHLLYIGNETRKRKIYEGK